MKKIGQFLKNAFTKDIPIKLLAIVIAVITVIFINI